MPDSFSSIFTSEFVPWVESYWLDISTWVAAAWPSLAAWLDKWQTLITGILALVGAWWTVRAVREQIGQVAQIEEERRRREEYAARSVLPLALQSITEYASAWIDALRSVPSHGGPLPATFHPPAIASDLTERLRECIRHVNRKQAKEIADLIAWLQVQYARSRDWPGGGFISQFDAQQGIVDAARLYAQASKLFPYGRRSEEGDIPRPIYEEMRTALIAHHIHEHEFQSIYQRVRRWQR